MLLPTLAVLSAPLAIVWPVLYRFVRLFARRRLRVRWYSFKYLLGFGCADLVLVSVLYWFNGNLLGTMIPPGMSVRLRIASVVVSGATLFGLTGLVFRPLRRHAAARAVCALLAWALPVVVAILRTGYRPSSVSAYTFEMGRASPAAPRMLILGIEGATLDQVLPLVSQGKLPQFDRLLQEGAHARLVAFRPCVSPVVWESLLTGKLPYKHQVLDSISYLLPGGREEIRLAPRGFGFRRLARLSGVREVSRDASGVAALTFLEIFDRFGVQTRRIGGEGPGLQATGEVPPDLLGRILDPEFPVPAGTEGLVEALRETLTRDYLSAALGLTAWRAEGNRIVVVILPGLDRIYHLFLRYATPEGFGNVSPAEVEKFGTVLERYYGYLDEILGEFLELAGESSRGGGRDLGALVLVVSPHGIEPLPLSRRILEGLEGNRFESGYHGRAPDGMVLAAGPGVFHGSPLGKVSVLDLVPTLLYRFGLPIGMDMDGHCVTRLFERSFVSASPILLIPSYEQSRIGGREPPHRSTLTGGAEMVE